MDYQVTVKVNDNFSIPLPESFVKKYHIEEGVEVLLIDNEDSISVIFPKKKVRGERFSQALQAVRESVKKSGGISESEIEDAVEKVRANEANN